MKCVDLLVEEHKSILLALNVLDAMSDRVSKGDHLGAEDVEDLLNFLRHFADEHHQGKEETALFPELRKTAAAQTDPIKHLIFEHDQERSLVAGLEEALRTRASENFAYYANRLCGILRTHIYKEEHILFDAVAKALSGKQDEIVSAEFAKLDRLDEKKRQEVFKDLHRLEWKYLGRTGTTDQEDAFPRDAASSEMR